MVARLYPSANLSSGSFRKHVVYADDRGDRGSGIGGRYNGRVRGRVRGGRGGRGIGGHIQGGCGGGSSAHEM